MYHSGNERKALYRRLFKYAEHRTARTKMLSYLFNRLKNPQLADVLDLLDNDPECRPATERASSGHPRGCRCDTCEWMRAKRRAK